MIPNAEGAGLAAADAARRLVAENASARRRDRAVKGRDAVHVFGRVFQHAQAAAAVLDCARG